MQKYIKNNFANDRIRYLMIDTDAFVLFVFKSNDELRLCVDYKNLNAITLKNKIFLFFIEKIFDRFVDAKYFTKLDFKNVYHKIRIKTENEWKIVFRTRYEFFEYAMMSFELTNAFAIFQTLINKIMNELIDKICVIYFDDILIYFKTKKNHWRFVDEVFEKLKNFNFYVKLSKCRFCVIFVKFLNYVISNNGISMNSNKVEIIRSWSISINFKKLQMFLKFVNFYRRFVVLYAKMSRSLFDLFKNNKNEKQIELF